MAVWDNYSKIPKVYFSIHLFHFSKKHLFFFGLFIHIAGGKTVYILILVTLFLFFNSFLFFLKVYFFYRVEKLFLAASDLEVFHHWTFICLFSVWNLKQRQTNQKFQNPTDQVTSALNFFTFWRKVFVNNHDYVRFKSVFVCSKFLVRGQKKSHLQLQPGAKHKNVVGSKVSNHTND